MGLGLDTSYCNVFCIPSLFLLGYKTYIGFMYLNLHHNDAVVNTFCFLLHKTIRPRTVKKSLRNSHAGKQFYNLVDKFYCCFRVGRNANRVKCPSKR